MTVKRDAPGTYWTTFKGRPRAYQLSKIKEEEIMDSVINCIPVYMPYASALFNNRAKSDRPKVIPKHSTNLAFTGEFVLEQLLIK